MSQQVLTAEQFRAKYTDAGQLAAKRKQTNPSKSEREAKRKAKATAKAAFDKYFSNICKAVGLPIPKPEHQFHSTRKWRIDYYFERDGLKVALEVEGGAWTNGRHTRGSGFLKDIEKYNALSIQGIYLVRTVPKQLTTQGISDVLAVFENL